MREPDFTAERVADELQCSLRMVWKLLRDGRLQSYRVGRRRRVTREQLDAFKAEQSVGADSV